MSVKGKSPSKRYAPLHFGGESATGQTRDGRFDKVVKCHCTFSISMMMTAQQARRIPWAQNFSAGSITVGRPFRRQERDQRAAALSRPLRRPRRLHPHPRVIHVGDIIIEENDIFGDGVNIAVRLEGIAEPGGISISDDARRQIRGKVDITFEDLGSQSLKNIAEPMRVRKLVYRNRGPGV
jgi:class 3 adenylate cyclase